MLAYAYDQIAAHFDAQSKIMSEASKVIKKIAYEERQHKNQIIRMGK